MINVVVVIGAGSIGQAIARRVSAGKHVLLADLRQTNADAAAKVLSEAGFEVSTAIVDVSSRKSVHALVETATAIGTMGSRRPEVGPRGGCVPGRCLWCPTIRLGRSSRPWGARLLVPAYRPPSGW